MFINKTEDKKNTNCYANNKYLNNFHIENAT